MPRRRMRRMPRDLKAALVADIAIALDTQNARIQDLALCLREDLHLSECTEMQALLALLVALRASCDALPAGDVMREVLSNILWTQPLRPSEEVEA